MRKLPDVSSRYGAPMGRPVKVPGTDYPHCLDVAEPETRAKVEAEAAKPRRFSLQRVRIDSGGYDSGGAYWGLGQPLYWYCSDDGEAEDFIRAASRDDAKAQVRDKYPAATFYR